MHVIFVCMVPCVAEYLNVYHVKEFFPLLFSRQIHLIALIWGHYN